MTDRRTSCDGIVRATHTRRAVKTMAVGYVKPFSSNTGTRQTGGQMIDGLRLTNRQIDYAISIYSEIPASIRGVKVYVKML